MPIKAAAVVPAVSGVAWVNPVLPERLTPPRRRRSARRQLA
jgi:hypothetical protein